MCAKKIKFGIIVHMLMHIWKVLLVIQSFHVQNIDVLDTVPINFDINEVWNKMSCYILHTVLLVPILLFIITTSFIIV